MKIKTLLTITASALLFLSGSALADTIIHDTYYIVPQGQIQNVHTISNLGKLVNGTCQFMHQIDYTYNIYYNGETLVLPASNLTEDTPNYRWTCARDDYSYSVNGQIKHVYEDYKIIVVNNDYKSSDPFKSTVVLK